MLSFKTIKKGTYKYCMNNNKKYSYYTKIITSLK